MFREEMQVLGLPGAEDVTDGTWTTTTWIGKTSRTA